MIATLVAAMLFITAPAAAQPSNLDEMRQRALELVNQSRTENGLPPLSLGSEANQAAQNHANDMLRRNYYAHTSPEGETVQDRYVAAGGSKWRLTAENIARCADCAPPVSMDRIERLHRGWMQSPEHRHNILRRGLTEFGYGIAVNEDQGLYAVQTFAGPGMPRNLQAGETPTAIAPEEQTRLAVERINRARRNAGLAPIMSSDPLNDAARSIAPGGLESAQGNALFEALPRDSRAGWRSLSALSATCGGCGTQPTASDVRFFVDQWLNDGGRESALLSPDMTHLGFAIAADGTGKKTAVALMGQKR
ncbi:CAP domain-containing protein [Rhodoligotrophos defluvii]|uniref:CAP domain-containing protein n=1 Tax=Rhodoligotrophos defluvii TaxID=2561934 RepID=UPI0014855F59|nr:CAP domain-containing protein [Rhodoligotrophos defluvii]